jgi:Flp pilus assembly pilin Flp
MRNRGQNLVEMAIIFAVIVIGAVIVLTALGKNINTMFTTSNEEYKTFEPFADATNYDYYDLKNYPEISVTGNADGSSSFTVGDQQVDIPKDLADVIDSQGASGDILREIAYMIEKYAAEYEPDDVPLQVYTGNSSRTDDKMTAQGRVDQVINNFSSIIQVGDHLVMLQSEDACEKVDGKECGDGEFKRLADFRLEGDIIDGQFIANVERTDEDSKVVKEMSHYQKDLDKLQTDLDKDLAKLQEDLDKAIAENDTKDIEKIQEDIAKANAEYQEDLAKLNEDHEEEMGKLDEKNRATVIYDIDTTDGYTFDFVSMETNMRGVDRKKIEEWTIDFEETAYNL